MIDEVPEGRVTIPVLSTWDLIQRVREALDVTRIDPDYEHWRFCMHIVQPGGEGESEFEFLTYRPTENLYPEAIRQYFKERGYFGHPAAFMAWLIDQGPRGYRASFPEDEACYRSGNGRLKAPSFHACEGGITLSLHPLNVILDVGGVYVAFRQVPGPDLGTK